MTTAGSSALWAPAITVGGALVIIALERLRPYDRQRFWRRGLGVDLIGFNGPHVEYQSAAIRPGHDGRRAHSQFAGEVVLAKPFCRHDDRHRGNGMVRQRYAAGVGVIR